MTNTGKSPNRLHVCTDHSYTMWFGRPYDVRRIHPVHGAGHHDHIKLSFYGGLSVDLTIAGATELARRLPEAIATPGIPDLSGSVAEIGEL